MVERSMDENSFNRDIHGKDYNKALLIAAMLIGSFVSNLNQSVLSIALPKLMESFRIAASTVQWLTTAFMLVSAIMIPVTALLLEKYSTKKLFALAMYLFGVGTVLCAVSYSFELLLIGRIIQAAGAGIMLPLITTVLLLIFPRDKRGAAMGLYGLVSVFAPALGPSLAGIILDNLDWHYLFYMLIPIILIDIVVIHFYMKDVIRLRNPKIDFISILLSTLGFGAMLYGFSIAGNKGWLAPSVIASILPGTILAGLFIWRQILMEKPMLELRVFKYRSFALTTIIGSILNIIFMGSGIIMPIFLIGIAGKSAFESGMVLLPGSLVTAFVMPFAGKLFDKHGVKKLVVPGIIIFTLSSIPFANLKMNTSMLLIVLLLSLRSIGIGLIITPLQTAGMNDLPGRLFTHASSVVNTAKSLMASLGCAILITVMSSIAAAHSPSIHQAKANPNLYKTAVIDSTLGGINAVNRLIIMLAILSLIITVFLKKERHQGIGDSN